MSASLEDLYKQVILDHYRSPRHRGELPVPPAVRADGYNPLCGDDVTVYLELADGTLKDLRQESRGCSISVASASMMSDVVAGKDMAEIRESVRRFKDLMRSHEEDLSQGQAIDSDTLGSEMGDLEALRGVVRFPVRIKCATLPWVTLEQGLADAESGGNGSRTSPVSTEEPAE